METKAGTILQLSLYSELVGAIQGSNPEYMHVVRPGVDFAPETFRVDDFAAYYRLVKVRLVAAVSAPDDPALYPVPVPECAVCRWWIQQLEQPQQAAHPEGTDVAALVHMLDGRRTLPRDKGLFLDTTWRLHPRITAFTSELYYEARLTARDGNDRLVLSGPTQFARAGLHYVPVDHEGNQSDAPEEVAAVQAVAQDLLQPGVRWTSPDGASRPLAVDDVLIVAPYNAQVAALQRALPGMRIGTVDKFQGQEAAVVIYSVTSFLREGAPRGMRFLYDSNRFNVATSRAHSAVIVVGNPRVFAPECRTPEQMRWANGLCRFRELAREVLP